MASLKLLKSLGMKPIEIDFRKFIEYNNLL